MIIIKLLLIFLLNACAATVEAVNGQPSSSNPYALGATCVYGIVGSGLLIKGLDGVSGGLISDGLADVLDHTNKKSLVRRLRAHADSYAKEEEKSPLKAWSRYIGLLLGSAVSISIAYRTWRQQSILQPYQQAYKTLLASSVVRGCATLGYLMASVAFIFRGLDGISGGALGEFMSDFLDDCGWKSGAKWFRDQSAGLMRYEEKAPIKAWLGYFANCFIGGLAIVSAYQTWSYGIDAPYVKVYRMVHTMCHTMYRGGRRLCIERLIAWKWLEPSEKNMKYYAEVDWFNRYAYSLNQAQPSVHEIFNPLNAKITNTNWSVISQLDYVKKQTEILNYWRQNPGNTVISKNMMKTFQANTGEFFEGLSKQGRGTEVAHKVVVEINKSIFGKLGIEQTSELALQLGSGAVKDVKPYKILSDLSKYAYRFSQSQPSIHEIFNPLTAEVTETNWPVISQLDYVKKQTAVLDYWRENSSNNIIAQNMMKTFQSNVVKFFESLSKQGLGTEVANKVIVDINERMLADLGMGQVPEISLQLGGETVKPGKLEA
jgi:hypothetical protein